MPVGRQDGVAGCGDRKLSLRTREGCTSGIRVNITVTLTKKALVEVLWPLVGMPDYAGMVTAIITRLPCARLVRKAVCGGQDESTDQEHSQQDPRS